MPLIHRFALSLACAALLLSSAAGPALAESARGKKSGRHEVSELAREKQAIARERAAETKRGQQLAETAIEYVGYPYRWGGASPASGFDCSGFVMYVYSTIGIGLPRDMGAQLARGRFIEFDELIPGDLVFFKNTYKAGLSHVGVYVGEGKFAHAVDESHGLVVSRIAAGYWAQRYAGASRPGTN